MQSAGCAVDVTCGEPSHFPCYCSVEQEGLAGIRPEFEGQVAKLVTNKCNLGERAGYLSSNFSAD